MNAQENRQATLMPMTVTEGLTVNVLPSKQYEFLMTTKEVAKGYGTSTYAIQQAFHRKSDELVEGKHFFTALTFCQREKISHPKDIGLPHNAIMFTKRGIVRLGFFIKSKRAKIFRDWAEDLIIAFDEQKDLFGAVAKPIAELPKKRNHNRLTQGRLLDIMVDVAKIENAELRTSIIKKLGL